MNETYTRIALDSISPSPYQMRKRFGGQDDADLAASISKHGVLQPIRVRPNGTPTTYELVMGERRVRGSRAAGLMDIPAIVVDLTDDQVIEQLIIENVQRKDLDALEEGEGYKRLTDDFGYTMDQLVSKTGRSRSHLYARMRLASLAPGPRKALQSGKLQTSVAELIASIPNQALQEQACKECLGEIDLNETHGLGIMPEMLNATDGGRESDGEPQPLSFRASHALIRRRYSLKLSLAKFDPADATLCPEAGSCASCIHRSGNQPELALPGVGKTAEDLCTNPPCHVAKTQAAWDRAAADAEARGLDVVAKDDADKMFQYDGVTVLPHAPFVDLNTPIPYDLDPTPGSHQTFGKLLGKRVTEVPHVLVQDGTGAARELLDKKAAIEKLKELGKLDAKPSKPEKAKATSADREKAEKAKAKREINEAALRRVLGTVASRAGEDLGKREVSFWRWIARGVFALINVGDADLVAERRDLKKAEDLADVIEKAKTAGDLRGIVAELLACLDGEIIHTGYGTPDRDTKDRFETGLSLLGIEWDEHVADAKEAIKVAAKAEEQTKAKKGGKKS